MRFLTSALLLALSIYCGLTSAAHAKCDAATGIGMSRIVEIDTRTGPLFGYQTRYQRAQSFLKPKEVVLTFDDGPMPWITKSILDTLDNHCTKATFFSVGRMAIAYPQTTRDIIGRGHTLGTHTWSHPLNLKRLKSESAVDEIERGFAAVALAAGRPIAPFFRFPGLNDNAALLTHLQSRGVGIFTVDAISNDSFIMDEARLIAHTMAQVEARQGGIVLFHDIKAATARALPTLLAQLKAKGYTVVHMRAAAGFDPLPQYTSQLAPVLAKAQPAGKGTLMPFYGVAPPAAATAVVASAEVRVDAIAPEAKVYAARGDETGRSKAAAAPKRPLIRTASANSLATSHTKPPSSQAKHASVTKGRIQHARTTPAPTTSWFGTSSSGWVTTVQPPKLRRSAVD